LIDWSSINVIVCFVDIGESVDCHSLHFT